jgi:hypothetical protein
LVQACISPLEMTASLDHRDPLIERLYNNEPCPSNCSAESALYRGKAAVRLHVSAEFNLLSLLTHEQLRPDNRPHSRNEDGSFGFSSNDCCPCH